MVPAEEIMQKKYFRANIFRMSQKLIGGVKITVKEKQIRKISCSIAFKCSVYLCAALLNSGWFLAP
jgi:hypothetical protein